MIYYIALRVIYRVLLRSYLGRIIFLIVKILIEKQVYCTNDTLRRINELNKKPKSSFTLYHTMKVYDKKYAEVIIDKFVRLGYIKKSLFKKNDVLTLTVSKIISLNQKTINSEIQQAILLNLQSGTKYLNWWMTQE